MACSKLDWDRVDDVIYSESSTDVDFIYNGIVLKDEMCVLECTRTESWDLIQTIKGNNSTLSSVP